MGEDNGDLQTVDIPIACGGGLAVQSDRGGVYEPVRVMLEIDSRPPGTGDDPSEPCMVSMFSFPLSVVEARAFADALLKAAEFSESQA